MQIVKPGHKYILANIDCGPGDPGQVLQFLQRKPHHEPLPGCLNQEVLRALIDRIQVLDAEKPWHGNAEILYCFRRALLLHEIRAMERDLETGSLKPELVQLDYRGHFFLRPK
jgi:hypothetical protein